MNIFYFILYHFQYSPKRYLLANFLDYLRFSLLEKLYCWIKPGDLTLFEKKIYSQNGEDGILEIIFKKIGTTNKYFVEFGVQDGKECNTRYLKDYKGWRGLMMDSESNSRHIKQAWITKHNIQKLFAKYKVPTSFDLLSIDIDGNDYWVWKAIKKYQPRVVLIEYNSHFAPPKSVTIKYDPKFKIDATNYFGASLSALNKLAKQKGYRLVACDSKGVNAFFVKTNLAEKHFKLRSEQQIYRPPRYGPKIKGGYLIHKKSKRMMLEV